MRTFGAFASMAVVGLLVGLAVLRKVADFGSKSPVARLVARREAVGGEQEDSDAYLNQWFLTKEEIFTSLGGVHRANMPAFSRGNKVAMLLDGSEVLGTMYSEVSSTKSEDKALGSFWSFGGKYMMKPPDQSTSMASVFGGALNRNVDTRMLLYNNPTHACEMKSSAEHLKDLGGHANLVDFPFGTGSHHHKMLALRLDGAYRSAYVGGIDPSAARWDTPSHVDRSASEQLQFSAQPLMMMCDVSCALPCGTELPNLDGVGWHDVGAWVWGPAAADIATTFIERWNALYSPTPESALYLDLPSNAGADGAADYTRLDDAPAAPADTASNVAVQTVRTSPCEQGGQFPFAPSGELTVLHAQLKAIRRATNYIYIEDQYFWAVDEITAALYEALDVVDFIVIIVQGKAELPGTNTFQEDIWSALLRHPNARTKLKGYTRTDGVYIHSKTTVIDDAYVSTGSANRNVRSMTLDSEIAIGAIDPAPATLAPDPGLPDAREQARSLRLRLWNDHARLSPTGVTAEFAATTVAEGVKVLDEAVNAGVLLPFTPDQVGLIDNLAELIEQDGRCGAPTCWNTPGCLWSVIAAGIVLLLLLWLVVWFKFEIVECCLYTSRYSCFACCRNSQLKRMFGDDDDDFANVGGSGSAATPDLAGSTGILPMAIAPTCNGALCTPALQFDREQRFILREARSMSFKSLMGADSFALRDTSGNVKMTLSGTAFDIYDTLEIRSASAADDGSEVNPDSAPVATIQKEHFKMNTTYSISLHQGSVPEGFNSSDSDGTRKLIAKRSCCTSCTGCCSLEQVHAEGAASKAPAMKTLAGKLNKAWLLPVFRYYSVDPDTGKLGQRPALVAEGNYLGTKYVVLNKKREICARISRKLLQRDSNNIYTIDVAASVDVAVVVSIVTIIDEIAEDD